MPYYVLFPVIMAFCSIGVYSVNANVYDLYAVAFFGLLGYVLVKLRCEPAPLLLGFVLGPLLEENLRRAMILSRGDPPIFLKRPLRRRHPLAAAMVLAIVCCRPCGASASRFSSRKTEAIERIRVRTLQITLSPRVAGRGEKKRCGLIVPPTQDPLVDRRTLLFPSPR